MVWLLIVIFFFCSYMYSRLTFTEDWYEEGWSPFFKKLFTGKLKFKH